MKKYKVYWQLFSSAFQLSAFTFGGGYVMIPLFRKKFVEQLHWLEEKEMMDLTAIAQAAPGAMAVNASILIGYRIAKLKGALITVLGTVLPPLIILSVISYFYAAFRDSIFVNVAMKGMGAGVVAVLFDVVITMGKSVAAENKLFLDIILGGAFLAACLFRINVMLIILVCGTAGALHLFYHEKRGADHDLS